MNHDLPLARLACSLVASEIARRAPLAALDVLAALDGCPADLVAAQVVELSRVLSRVDLLALDVPVETARSVAHVLVDVAHVLVALDYGLTPDQRAHDVERLNDLHVVAGLLGQPVDDDPDREIAALVEHALDDLLAIANL
jgi:hypothetical protein